MRRCVRKHKGKTKIICMQAGLWFEDQFYPDADDGCAFCLRPVQSRGPFVTMGACCRRRCHIPCVVNSMWNSPKFMDTPCPQCLRKPDSHPHVIGQPKPPVVPPAVASFLRSAGILDMRRKDWIASMGIAVYSTTSTKGDSEADLVLFAARTEDGQNLPTDYLVLKKMGLSVSVLLAAFPALSVEWWRSLVVDMQNIHDFSQNCLRFAERYGRATDVLRGIYFGLAHVIFGQLTDGDLRALGVYGEDLLGMGLMEQQSATMVVSQHYFAKALQYDE